MTVGGLLSGLIVYTLAPEAEGHGTVAAALQAYRAVVRRGVRRIGSLAEGTSLVEARVEPGAPLAGTRLAAAGLPAGAVVMALRRHGEVRVPRGATTLQPGDTLTVVVTPDAEAALQDWLAAHARVPAPAPGGGTPAPAPTPGDGTGAGA